MNAWIGNNNLEHYFDPTFFFKASITDHYLVFRTTNLDMLLQGYRDILYSDEVK